MREIEGGVKVAERCSRQSRAVNGQSGHHAAGRHTLHPLATHDLSCAANKPDGGLPCQTAVKLWSALVAWLLVLVLGAGAVARVIVS